MRAGRLLRAPAAAAACALGLLVACVPPRGGTSNVGGGSTTKASPPIACARSAQRPVPPELLDSLAVIATNTVRDSKDTGVVTEADLDKYIARLLDDERFARDVAPRMLASQIVEYSGSLEYPMVLQTDPATGVVYAPFHGKCAAEKAVDVHPWWALDTTIKVCPESYQPTHLKVAEKQTYCGGNPPDRQCGCGPNLAFCAKDDEQKKALIKSMQEETLLLIARTVRSDARLEQMWTANETERDRNAELVYRRWRISAGESPDILADLKDWPTTPVLRPRHEQSPRQHAGILTVSGAMGIEMSIRARMKWFYQALWCDEPPGGTVATEAVLGLNVKGGNVRIGDGWKELASKPICTDCHARLDYGGQFFAGFGVATAYDPKDHLAGMGNLYGASIDDYRGKANLDPRSFAELAVAQPEYAQCVVKNVKRRVLDDVWDTTSDDALKRAFDERHSLKSVMRVALRAFADKRLSAGCATSASATKPEGLEHMFDTVCKSCHGPSRAPDFGNLSDRGTLTRALEAVAFGRMPPPPFAMTTNERRRATELLVQRIWTDEKARREARAYFEEQRPAPVHSVAGLLNVIDHRAGYAGKPLRFEDVGTLDESDRRGDLLRYSPAIESIISLEALSACKATGARGKELEACILRATDLGSTTR